MLNIILPDGSKAVIDPNAGKYSNFLHMNRSKSPNLGAATLNYKPLYLQEEHQCIKCASVHQNISASNQMHS